MPGRLTQPASDLIGLLAALGLLYGFATVVGVIGLCGVALSWTVLRASASSRMLWTYRRHRD